MQRQRPIWMKHAFQQAPIGMGMIDAGGRWMQVNDALCELLGYTEKELLASTFMSLGHPDDIYRDAVLMDQLLAGVARTYEVDKRCVHKNGGTIWVSLSAVMYGGGKRRTEPPLFLLYFKDITSRKLEELELKESVQRFRYLFDQSPDMTYFATLDGDMVHLNQACEQITGYTSEELTQIGQLVSEEEKEGLSRLFDKARLGVPQSFEMQIRRKNGDTIDASVLHMPNATDGKATGVYGIARDITQIKKQNEAHKESERLYRLLAENSIDWICRITTDGMLLYVSQACRSLLGYEPEEMIGQSVTRFIYPEDLRRVTGYWDGFDYTASDMSRNSYRIVRKDGSPIWIEVVTRLVFDERTGEHLESISVFRDITERKQQEERLRVSEEMFNLISQNALDMISYTSPDGVFRYVSPSVYTLLGYKPEDMVGRHGYELIHEDDVQMIIDAGLLREADIGLYTVRVKHKDGHYLWFESMLKAIRDEHGTLEKVLAIARDTTERKLAEDELVKQEERYRELVEQSPDGVIISSKGQWLYVNDTAVSMLGGVSKEEVLRHAEAVIHPEFAAEALRRLEQVERGETSELIEQTYIRLDGRPIAVEVKSIPTVYQQEPAIHTIVRDVSERKRTQELLKASEKLNIAGQLAAGIAHEIRNPLTSLKGFLQYLRPEAADKQDYFDIMLGEIDRIELIVDELLVLAKPGKGEAFRELDARPLLRQVVTLLQAQARLADVQLTLEVDEEPALLRGDENQLKQVFINIIKNAIEAMTRGGEVVVALRKHRGELCVSITDQGPGIPAESLSRLGEPFFTSKSAGTGLGLMVSFKIVEHHGGAISVQSQPEAGTAFHVRLPLLAQKDKLS